MIYFIVGITMGALFTIKPVHDFVLQSPIFAGAHSHINLIGWVSLAIIGGIYMMIKDKPMHSEKIGNTGFWLLNSGIAIMFILMLIAGYIGSSLAIPVRHVCHNIGIRGWVYYCSFMSFLH